MFTITSNMTMFDISIYTLGFPVNVTHNIMACLFVSGHYSIPYYTMLYYTILHYTSLYYTILYYTILLYIYILYYTNPL